MKRINHREHRELNMLRKNTQKTQRKNKKVIATDEHGNTRIKKIFYCFKQKIEWDGLGISVCQCKSVAN